MNISDRLPQGWNEWAAFAQIVQVFVVLYALYYAKGQVEEAGRARKLQATRELLNEIGSDDIRDARHHVLREMSANEDIDLSGLADRDLQARRVAVAYDRVGYMVSQHLIPEDALFYFQRDEIDALWKRLEPYIIKVRNNPARRNYCRHFEELATQWLPTMRKKEAAGLLPKSSP